MSLLTNFQTLITVQGTTVKNVRTAISGSGTDDAAAVAAKLATTASDVVAAINEVKLVADAASGAAVTSVNGEAGPGAVVVTTTNVAEGTGLYFTAARALATVLTGYTAGAGTVAATDTIQAALQKLDGNVAAIDLTDLIDDASAATTTVYSSTKTTADIAAAVAALVASSPGTLDTLNELATAIGNDPNFATTLASSLAAKANIADTFSVTQLGTGIDSHNFATDWATAIA